MFNEEVCKGLGHYVYRLIDPRNGNTFYVGRGQGNRVFQHANAALNPENDPESNKLSSIRAIHNAGLKVVHVIHRHSIPADMVAEVEASLIDAYPGLSNVQGGEGSGDRGPMSTVEIIDKFSLPAIDTPPEEKLVLVNINRLEDLTNRDAIYEQTRLAWRISSTRANQADFVLGVVRGVVRGAFQVDARGWRAADHENFPDRIPEGDSRTGRYGFCGKNAAPDIWEKFVGARGKRIEVESMKHIQNPIRYWNIV
mgnify:CR=1 FL=1